MTSSQKLARIRKILWLCFGLVVLVALVCAISLVVGMYSSMSIGISELVVILFILILLSSIAAGICILAYLLYKSHLEKDDQIFL